MSINTLGVTFLLLFFYVLLFCFIFLGITFFVCVLRLLVFSSFLGITSCSVVCDLVLVVMDLGGCL